MLTNCEFGVENYCEVKIEECSDYLDCSSSKANDDSVANLTEESVNSEDYASTSVEKESFKPIEAVYIKEVNLIFIFK